MVIAASLAGSDQPSAPSLGEGVHAPWGHSAAQRPDGGDARGSAVPSCPALLLGTPQSLPAGVPLPSGLLCVAIRALLPSPGPFELWETPLCLCHQVGGIKAAPFPHTPPLPQPSSLSSFLSSLTKGSESKAASKSLTGTVT